VRRSRSRGTRGDAGGRLGLCPCRRLPLLLTAYGPSGALPTIIAALCLTILFICGTIAVLEVTRASGSWTFRVAAQVATKVFSNPAVISPLLGILFAMTHLPLPKAVSNYLDLMAACGSGTLSAACLLGDFLQCPCGGTGT
jgi:malonate transporter and related proteins